MRKESSVLLKLSKIFFPVILLTVMCSSRLAAAAVFDENDMAAAVIDEFAEQGVEGTLEVEFFGGKTKFVLPDAQRARIMIFNLKVDEAQNKFTAEAEIFADGKQVEQTQLSGRYFLIVRAYVPHATLEKGTLITEDDLKEISIRANRIRDNNIVDKDKLVGLQARKTLKEGRLIAERDVGEKLVIRKGDIVTAVYKSKGLQITSKAEALEDGAKGQRIEVENTKSGKKFMAKVADSGVVEIDNE